jgi:iron complex transport system substrate-binding protein
MRIPVAVCVEWLQPLMGAGNWMPELVELAGGDRSSAGQAGQAFRLAGLGRHCDKSLIPKSSWSCPAVLISKRTRDGNGGAWSRNPGLGLACGAVKKPPGIRSPMETRYFNRPGPRVVESLEILTEIIHPGRFNFGHEGKGWEKL